MKRIGIVVFPGTNCDRDVKYAFIHNGIKNVDYIWYKEKDISRYKIIILPGGFSFGDYLRTGGLAIHSPVFSQIKEYLRNDGYVIGICNGFQMLVESHLLPGFLLRNTSNLFISKMVYLKVLNNKTPFTSEYKKGEIIMMPIAHTTGNYQPINTENIDEDVIFQYVDEKGKPTKRANPNGSYKNIAGIISKDRHILGLMPHFERVCDEYLGLYGVPLIRSIKKNILE